MLHSIFVLISLSLIWASSLANAGTYWVAKTGKDGHSCSQAQSPSSAKLTITSALSCLGPGDTLLVKAGTYNESFYDNIPGGTSWSAPVRIAADSEESVTIRPNPGGERPFTFASSRAKYIIIDGFILDAANGKSDVIKITNGSRGAASHIRIMNSELKNARNQGILVGEHSPNNQFINLHIHHNGRDIGYDHGMYITSSGNLIQGCLIHDHPGYGIHLYSGRGNTASRNLLEGNRVHNNGRVGEDGGGIIISSGDENIARNNIVWNNRGHWGGIRADLRATDTLIQNNTVYNNKSYGIYVGSRARDTRVQNNIVYANSVSNAGGGTVLSNNFTTDPLFVNAANGDFRLRAGSPAIDKGARVSEVLPDVPTAPASPTNLSVGQH